MFGVDNWCGLVDYLAYFRNENTTAAKVSYSIESKEFFTIIIELFSLDAYSHYLCTHN